jgi:hypothetical protein
MDITLFVVYVIEDLYETALEDDEEYASRIRHHLLTMDNLRAFLKEDVLCPAFSALDEDKLFILLNSIDYDYARDTLLARLDINVFDLDTKNE